MKGPWIERLWSGHALDPECVLVLCVTRDYLAHGGVLGEGAMDLLGQARLPEDWRPRFVGHTELFRLGQ